MLRKILFCFFLQILLYYYKPSVSSPLIGKSAPAKINEFTFIVSLSRDYNFIDIDNHFCAGALISKRHVLTAHHCMEDENTKHVLVIACTLDFSCGKIYRIQSYSSYDGWKYFTGDKNDRDEEEHDIGIITLNQDVKNVQPAIISDTSAEQLYRKIVVTAGWGFIDEDKLERPKTLAKANLKILNPDEYKRYTKKRYGYSKTPQPQFYYTVSNSWSPVVLSSSDSGGPLVLEGTNELIGVNFGHTVESPGSLPITSSPPKYSINVHTRINYAKHQQFIQEIVGASEFSIIIV